MAAGLTFSIFTLLFLALVTTTIIDPAQARPLNIIQMFGGIKDGPSPGVGHKYTNNIQTLGGIKDGPSPGVGHKYTNIETLGGIKDGPSPGVGHKYTNIIKTLGGIKDGPSPGEGHSSITGTN